MSPLTLLTATGCRPQAWALCQSWMDAQDYAGPVRWIVVDDGPHPQPISFRRDHWDIEVVRPEPYWQPGQNTQARNLLAGLDLVPADAHLLIIEDDDHYAPSWLRMASYAMSQAELVGETRSRYYNVSDWRWREHSNTAHASLCATGMRGPAISLFRQLCASQTRHLDMLLWRSYSGSKRRFSSHLVTGIKGLPGRAGIGIGHLPAMRKGTPDPTGARLSAWLGKDAGAYLSLMSAPASRTAPR